MWVITLLLCGGVFCSTNGQEYQQGSPTIPSYPLRFDVTESTYLAENDNGNRQTFKLVNPNPSRSFSYVAPKNVEDPNVARDKREDSRSDDNDDFDYTKSYREFVRENFGLDDAKAFVEEGEDDGGEDREYARIKELSHKQSEDKENSKYCKLVHKDGKDCTICKNPKSKAESETCSYSSKPKPKKYAYKRERNYNSKDDYDDDDGDDGDDHEEEASQKNERRSPKNIKQNNTKISSKKSNTNQKNGQHPDSQHESKVKTKSSKRSKSKKPVPRQASEYYSDQALKSTEPYSSTIGSGKVDRVLEEFKKRDWSKCKKKSRDGLTCYYCRDPKGGNHEECMYISDDEASASTLIDEYQLPPTENVQENQKNAGQQQLYQSHQKRSDKIAPNPDIEGNPENHQTFKRMVSVKIHEDDGDNDPSSKQAVFYKRIVQVDRK